MCPWDCSDLLHSTHALTYAHTHICTYLNVYTHTHACTAFVTVYLVDSVTGGVVHHTTHKQAAGPVFLVHSENWIVVRLTEISEWGVACMAPMLENLH